MNYKASLTIGALLLSTHLSVFAATTACILPQKQFQLGMKDGKEKTLPLSKQY